MTDDPTNDTSPETTAEDPESQGRRDFLMGLGRWSKAAIGAALLGGLALPGADAEAGWVNRRPGGGTWANRRGGGGWANRRGGGGAWANRNGGGWANRNGGWVNRRPGGTWANVR